MRETHCRTSRAYILQSRECQLVASAWIHSAGPVGCEAELAADRSWRNKRLTRREATLVRPRVVDLAVVASRGEPVRPSQARRSGAGGVEQCGVESCREETEFRLRVRCADVFVLRSILRFFCSQSPRARDDPRFHFAPTVLPRPLARTAPPARCCDDSTTPETPGTDAGPLASQKLARSQAN